MTQAEAQAGGQLGNHRQQPRRQGGSNQLIGGQVAAEQHPQQQLEVSSAAQQELQQQHQPELQQRGGGSGMRGGAAALVRRHQQLQAEQLEEAEFDPEQPQQRHDKQAVNIGAAQALMPQQQQQMQLRQPNAGQRAAAGVLAVPQLQLGQHPDEQEVSEADFDLEQPVQQQATGRGWGAQEAAAMALQLQQQARQQTHAQQAWQQPRQGVDVADAADGEILAHQASAGVQQVSSADVAHLQPLIENEGQEADGGVAAVMQQEAARQGSAVSASDGSDSGDASAAEAADGPAIQPHVLSLPLVPVAAIEDADVEEDDAEEDGAADRAAADEQLQQQTDSQDGQSAALMAAVAAGSAGIWRSRRQPERQSHQQGASAGALRSGSGSGPNGADFAEAEQQRQQQQPQTGVAQDAQGLSQSLAAQESASQDDFQVPRFRACFSLRVYLMGLGHAEI